MYPWYVYQYHGHIALKEHFFFLFHATYIYYFMKCLFCGVVGAWLELRLITGLSFLTFKLINKIRLTKIICRYIFV